MLTEPSIWVMCDFCGYEDEVPLSSNGLGGYDERNVTLTIIAWGWEAEEDKHKCPRCLASDRWVVGEKSDDKA